MKNFLFVILFFIMFSCSKNSNKKTLFISHPKSTTGINFSNLLSYTEQLNPYTYRNFYNGGGVGIGDFNNDSLPDVFYLAETGSARGGGYSYGGVHSDYYRVDGRGRGIPIICGRSISKASAWGSAGALCDQFPVVEQPVS